MKHVIRKSEKRDCPAIAHVVTVAWNESYRGIVADLELAQMRESEEERARNASDRFDECGYHQLVLEADDEVVGFVNYGKADDEDYEDCGEIFALYIIRKYQGHGYGRELFMASTEELHKQGFDRLLVRCLKGNPANGFYVRMGGTYVKDGVYKRLQLPENVYYFDGSKEKGQS